MEESSNCPFLLYSEEGVQELCPCIAVEFYSAWITAVSCFQSGGFPEFCMDSDDQNSSVTETTFKSRN